MPDDDGKTSLDEANVLLVQAEAIRQLADAGFDKNAAVRAVKHNDVGLLLTEPPATQSE